MTALLTDYLPLLAGAPNGIKKLRELILELAVRGRLLPQDPSDEPASELLNRITEEKARLVADGKIKKQKSLTKITEDDHLFGLPVGWEWGRFNDVCIYIQRGKGPAYIEHSDFAVVSQKCIRWTGLDLSPVRYVDPESIQKYEEIRFLRPGDILWNSTGTGTMGRACVVNEHALLKPLVVDSHVTIVRPIQIEPVFLWRWIQSPSVQSDIVGNASGTTNQIELNTSTVLTHLIPVPPLAEQHRIVAKVDELMALCDRLEAQQADANSAHAQLVQALLDSLVQARDAEDFAQSWERLADHFHTLFTTEPSIDALKQTLLQLAVMGKLVPQDPSDEPASELLERIQKSRWSQREKKQKPLTESPDQEKPFELPHHWAWTTLPTVGELARGKSRHRPRNDPSLYARGNVPLIQTGDVARADGVVQTYSAMYNAKGVEQSRLWPAGTMCITIAANIADSAILGFDACFPDSVVGFIPGLPELDVRYFEFFVRTAKSHLEDFAPSTAQKNINLEILGLLSVPLPPANELNRIVVKVDQLIALCDQLKVRLNQARQVHEHLANALVENALNASRQQTPATPDQKAARTLLAAEITHQLHGLKTFGQRKLQKVTYLAEHAARLAAIQGNYLRDAAGPHDRQLMDQIEVALHSHQWYERIERDTVGHAYRPLSAAGQHRPGYESTWSAAERATIQQVIDLMRGWDTNRCERVVTLYAAWNDFLLEGKSVTDEMLVHEVLYSWNDTKLRFTEDEWRAELAEMKKHKLLIPSGFGKRTQGGLQTLPGLH